MKLPKFYHAMEIWFTKMSAGDNPTFADEMNMRKVNSLLMFYCAYSAGNCNLFVCKIRAGNLCYPKYSKTASVDLITLQRPFFLA